MYVSYSYELCVVLLVVLSEIRNVLEVVGVYVTVCSCYIRLYIVIEFYDFESPAFLCKLP